MKSKSFLGHFKRKRKKKQKIDLVVYERSAACICWIRFNLTFLQKENATCVFPCFSRVVFWLASFIQWRLDGRVSYFFLASNPPYISTAHCTQTITLYRLLLHFSFLFYHFPSFGHSFVFFFSSLQKSSFFFLLSSICHLEFFQPTHTYTHTHRIFTVFPFSKRLCFVWFYPDDVRNASPSKLFAQKENKERERRERWRLDYARPSVLYMRVRDTPDTDIFRESRTIDVE